MKVPTRKAKWLCMAIPCMLRGVSVRVKFTLYNIRGGDGASSRAFVGSERECLWNACMGDV